MGFTVNDLLKGKETIIKDKEFLSTKAYLEPFLNIMSKYTNDFRVKAVTPEQLTKANEQEDITFNRVLVQAVLPPSYTIDKHDEVIGFLYGLDVKSPIAKIYRGHLNQACTNLSVFSPTWIEVQEINPMEPLNYSPVKTLMEKENIFSIKLKELKNTTISRNDRLLYLGKWIDYSIREYDNYNYGKVKIASSVPISAYTELFVNSDSEYFIPEGIDPSLFDIYNSFTQIITDDKKDILNKFEKTILINKLLEI